MRLRVKYIVIGVAAMLVLHYFGAFTHVFELDFYHNFTYPYPGDVTRYVRQLRQGVTPDLQPINVYNQTFLSTSSHKCKDNAGVRLIYLIKSAMHHFKRRQAIRSTWGFERRFSDVPIRTIFLLGVSVSDGDIQKLVDKEKDMFHDIVQIDFVDNYFNNTFKTMNGFRWAVEYCPNSQFYFFSDDDMYISTKNVLQFLRNPTHYPQYLELPAFSGKSLKNIKQEPKDTKDVGSVNENHPDVNKRYLKQVLDFELATDVMLFSGFVFISSPHRHKSSKWHVSLSEYPYHLWPPYVTAGSYVLSKEALFEMYYTSQYTKHFRFDDIYLGLVALKAGIEPFHCEEFHFYKKEYTTYNYKYVIASHGYDDPEELMKVWTEQRASGYA